MALQPNASKLRHNIRFDKREIVDDGMGNERANWIPFVERKCNLVPTRRAGNEEAVIANRLTGSSIWDCIVYFDEKTSQVKADDRAVEILDDGSDGTEYNIRFVGDLFGNKRWLFMQLQEGVASG